MGKENKCLRGTLTYREHICPHMNILLGWKNPDI
jgi:hypothetical protein